MKKSSNNNSRSHKLGAAIKANKKKIIIVASMVALLVATGCLNYFLNVKANKDIPANGDDTSIATFFETYRSDRLTTRDQEIVYLDDIIASTVSTPEAIANAEAKKLAITDTMETELILEGLIKAKGFTDCVVTISADAVNVVVVDEDLTLTEAAQILDIIVSQTEFTAPDVTIFPYV